MGTGFDVEVVILIDRFDELLGKFPDKVDAGLEKWATAAMADARHRAPRKTGYMADHIDVEKTGHMEYTVKSPAHYSLFVERGTHKMAPRPFLYPACLQAGSRMQEDFASLIGVVL